MERTFEKGRVRQNLRLELVKWHKAHSRKRDQNHGIGVLFRGQDDVSRRGGYACFSVEWVPKRAPSQSASGANGFMRRDLTHVGVEDVSPVVEARPTAVDRTSGMLRRRIPCWVIVQLRALVVACHRQCRNKQKPDTESETRGHHQPPSRDHGSSPHATLYLDGESPVRR